MKTFYLLVLLVLPAMAWCGPIQIKIQINNNGKKAICILQTPDSRYQVQPDSTGLAIVLLPENTRKGYGTLFHGMLRIPLYFNQQSFDMTITPDDKALNPVFSGPEGMINTYLNTPPLALWTPDYKPGEAEFAIVLDREEKKLIRNLDSCQLDADFTRWERERLHYMVHGRWGLYPLFHKYAIKAEGKIPDPTDVYYQSLQKLLVEDEALLKLVDYRLALSDVVCFIPVRGVLNGPELDKLKLKLDFIEKNFKNPVIISHVVNEVITRYVESQGVEALAYFGPIYNQKVIDESAKKAFNALCLKMGNVSIGHVSPDFCYPDIDGKEVSLKDLAGKYVYIDVWATWCGPCKAQIPALKELEKRYAGKDIHFVSMSSDANKKAWEKMVKAEQLTGIQLIMNDNQKFMNAYMIEGIPRFILLDKEGKIIQPDMSRPSDPKTVEALDKLLN